MDNFLFLRIEKILQENHDELVKSLKQLSQQFAIEIVEFLPHGGMIEIGKFMYSLDMLIGAHGAGMNNYYWCREGTVVIEIGFYDSSFTLPDMYYCFARSIGLKYYSSLALHGGYGTPLKADIPDIMEIVSGEVEAFLKK